ncbi:MAG: hypothetical protein ACI9R3_003968 [Verrucomicrobiales bacterium]
MIEQLRMKIWIRHVDGTVEDLGTATEGDAVVRFLNYDWELAREDYDAEKDGPDHCLPAFGMINGEIASCDITPFSNDACKVNLYYHRPSTFFGLFPMNKNVWKHLPDYPMKQFKEVVSRFYAEDIDGLSKLIEAEKNRQS